MWSATRAINALGRRRRSLLLLPEESYLSLSSSSSLSCSTITTLTIPRKPRQTHHPPHLQHQPHHQHHHHLHHRRPFSSLVSRCPKPLQPYLRLARLDKPIGIWLLLWPGYWSIAMAAAPGGLPDWKLLTVFGVGTVVMRSAGCTVNDLWDRDIDKNVERTKTRPITSGEISVQNGVLFLGAQLLTGLGVLVNLNEYSIYLGMASVPLVVAYPLMKRWTNYPQLFLGMTFNWGALLGWAAVHGTCDWSVVVPLYTSAVAWTMVYDTLYAHQDKKDDARLGLHSTALTFGEEGTKPILMGFSALMVGGLTLAGIQADLAWPFFAGTGMTAAHLLWQIRTADLNDSANLAARFEANKWVGGLVFGGIVAGRWMAENSGVLAELTTTTTAAMM